MGAGQSRRVDAAHEKSLAFFDCVSFHDMVYWRHDPSLSSVLEAEDPRFLG